MAFSFFGSKTPAPTDPQDTAATPPLPPPPPPPMPSVDPASAPAPASLNDVTPPSAPMPPAPASVIAPMPAPDPQTAPSDSFSLPEATAIEPEETPKPEVSLDPSSFIFSADSLKPDEPTEKPEEEEKPALKLEGLTKEEEPAEDPLSEMHLPVSHQSSLPPIDEDQKEDTGDFSDKARHEVEEVLKHDIEAEEQEIARLEKEIEVADKAHRSASEDLENRKKALLEYEQKIQEQQHKVNDMKEDARARKDRLSQVLKDL